MRAQRRYQTFKPKLMASIAALAITGAGLVAFAGTASAASTAPAWEPDTGSGLGSTGYGQIVFYDAQGNVVTSGTNLNNPFAYAVGATPKDAGVTFTQLIFANPQSGVLTANWTALNQTSSIIANITGAPADVQSLIATNPVVAAGTQASIFNYEATENVDPTPGYGHVLQIRETDSGPNQAGNSGTGNYWESDVAFNNTSAPITVLGVTLAPGTWQQLFPTVTTTTTSLTSNAPAGGVAPGTPITLTAKSSDTSAAGTFNFFDGTKLIGSAPAASGSGSFTYTPSADENASFTASFVPTLGDVQNPNTANATMVSSSTSAAVAVSVTGTKTKTATTTTLTASPTSINVGASDTLTATVTESDSGSSGVAGTVGFYDGSTELGSQATTVSGTTGTATLSTSSLPVGTDSLTAKFTPTDTTDYAGSTSAPVSVTVTQPVPTVTTQPSNAEVAVGDTATFTAAATVPDSGTLSVQWKSALPGSSTFTNISGATSDSYTTPATTAADNGTKYEAVFTDSTGGSTTTNAAVLTVDSPATVTTQPTSKTVPAGSTATFTAAASGTPTPTVQWMSAPSGSSTFTDISGATSDSYTTPATTTADNGTQYKAVFTNTIGSTTHTATSNVATLTVVPAPTITTQPSDATVTQGATATFTAAATAPGGATPTVQWESEAPNGTSFQPISGATSESYTTPATGAADNGTKYKAVFTNTVNGVGATATSNPATLTVLVPATVAIQPKSQTVTVGGTATFTATGSGTAPVSVQWQSEGPKDSSFTPISGANSDTLTVPNVTLAESGTQYEAVFSNTINGTAETATSNPATLTVVAAPPVNHTLGTWSGAPGTAGSYVSAHLGMAPNTSPAIATLSNGKVAVAFQANTGALWTWIGTPGSTGSATSTKLGMAPGTSPSITALKNGKAAVGFQANTGALWTWDGTPGTVGAATSARLGMKAGTSPAITTLSTGKVAVGFQANTGALWTWTGTPMSTGFATSARLGMAPGTSPSITAMANGKAAASFQANTGALWTWHGTPGTVGGATSARLGMKAGTSPAITTLSTGKAAVAFQANTGALWTWTGTPGNVGSAASTKLGMAPGTSPSITALKNGKAAVGFQANTGVLWTWDGAPRTVGGASSTKAAMPAGTSPAVTPLANGEIDAAF